MKKKKKKMEKKTNVKKYEELSHTLWKSLKKLIPT